MGKVRVHFEYVVVAMVERPAETGDVGRSEAHLARSLDQEEGVRVGLLQGFHHIGGPVGGAVVDYQYMIVSFEGEDGRDDLGYVLHLLVRRNYDEFLFHILQR